MKRRWPAEGKNRGRLGEEGSREEEVVSRSANKNGARYLSFVVVCTDSRFSFLVPDLSTGMTNFHDSVLLASSSRKAASVARWEWNVGTACRQTICGGSRSGAVPLPSLDCNARYTQKMRTGDIEAAVESTSHADVMGRRWLMLFGESAGAG